MEHDELKDAPLGDEVIESLDAGLAPSEAFEDRVVAAMRERSLVRGAGGAGGARASRTARMRRGTFAWLGGALAAGLVFAAGMQVGARRATSAGAPLLEAIRDSSAAAVRVRRAAFEYITALSQVPPTDLRARSVAVATYRTAADQIMRIAPQSDIAVAIGVAFPSSYAQSPATLAATPLRKRIIWF